jgi:hypothetical protein
LKLSRANGKIVVRNNDFKNAIKSLAVLALGFWVLMPLINRLIDGENAPILLAIFGFLVGTAFLIFGGRLLLIGFARLITLDVPGKLISVRIHRFMGSKTYHYTFSDIDRFEASPCATDEACFDLKLKDGVTLEIGSKSKDQLADLKFIAEELNNEVRK